jgi:flagellar hook-length control protein FliK
VIRRRAFFGIENACPLSPTFRTRELASMIHLPAFAPPAAVQHAGPAATTPTATVPAAVPAATGQAPTASKFAALVAVGIKGLARVVLSPAGAEPSPLDGTKTTLTDVVKRLPEGKEAKPTDQLTNPLATLAALVLTAVAPGQNPQTTASPAKAPIPVGVHAESQKGSPITDGAATTTLPPGPDPSPIPKPEGGLLQGPISKADPQVDPGAAKPALVPGAQQVTEKTAVPQSAPAAPKETGNSDARPAPNTSPIDAKRLVDSPGQTLRAAVLGVNPPLQKGPVAPSAAANADSVGEALASAPTPRASRANVEVPPADAARPPTADVAAAPLAPATERTARPVPAAEQVGAAIVAHWEGIQREGTTTLHLRLNPPDLGTVRVALSVKEQAVNARLVVQVESTRQLLESQVGLLRDKLQGSGVALGQFSVTCDNAGGGRQWQQAPVEQPTARPVRPVAANSPAAPPRAPGSRGQLDVLA